MSGKRSGRGPHPKDLRSFTPEELPRLRQAVDDLCWLLSRGYSRPAALALVGDRHRLRDRQRKALQRCAASDDDTRRRAGNRVEPEQMRGETLLVDGFNVVLTLEAALAGGILLLARDGALRDLSSLERHYRQSDTTRPALCLAGNYLSSIGVAAVRFVLDRPISNSGRLRRLMEDCAGEHDWPWTVELVANADASLCRSPHVVASADSHVLDRCLRWHNLARLTVERLVPDGWIVAP